MQYTDDAIERILALIETLHRRGAYRESYGLARRGIDLCHRSSAGPDACSRILLLAAKSAYYVGEFDESLSLLDAAAALFGDLPQDRRDRFSHASTVVRANVLRRRGRFAEALSLLEARSAEHASLPSALLLESLLVEGACRFYLNDIHRAEERLEAALGLAIHHGDVRMKSRVLVMLGLVVQLRGRHETALEYFSRAADICRAEGDRYGEAAAALNAAIALYRRGSFEKAAWSAERARTIFENIGWNLGECRALLALGNIAKCRGEHRGASRLYARAGRLAARRGFARERALALEFIGDICAARGKPRLAERCFGAALRIAESSAPDGDIVVEVNRRIGELLLSQGTVDGALTFLRRALRFSQKLGDRLEEGAVLRCLGKASFMMGAGERGKNLFGRAVATLRGAGCDFELARTHLDLAEILLAPAPGGGALRPAAQADSDVLDAAWRSAVEASHLFGYMDAGRWKTAAELLVESVAAMRARRPLGAPNVARASKAVEIGPSPATLLCDGFVAISPSMLEVWRQMRFAAAYGRPVLVTGETGTGKELVARIIHLQSARRERPFIPLNCAAVPDHLFESEFFGHRRGSFTGALTDRVGLFEGANGGTLFLDEVGELTPLQQVKLLRVLQEEKIRRLGENTERPVDVRIISATNQDLGEKLAKQSLRKDFYYRINAEHIHVPPLRERREDVVPLIAHFLCANGGGGAGIRIELEALRSLQRYQWPGNVRELFAVLERLKHISDGGTIVLDMLPERIKPAVGAGEASAGAGSDRRMEAARRLQRALEACGGNKSAAARWLGISRGTLYKELRRLGLLTCGGAGLGISPGAADPRRGTAA